MCNCISSCIYPWLQCLADLCTQVNWRKLLELSESVTDEIAKLQGGYKKKLFTDVKAFVIDVVQFRNDYLANGPMVKGISPSEAMDRLRRYGDEFELRARKYELYSGGVYGRDLIVVSVCMCV